MKRTLKKRNILIAAILVIVFILTACGGGSGTPGNTAGGEETKSNDPTGKYTATMNMKQYINEGVATSGISFDSDINVNMYLELKKDGTFTLEMIGSELSSAVSDVMKKEGPDIIKNLLIKSGIAEDQFDSVAVASGYENYDAFIDSMLAQVDEELESAMTSEIEEKMKAEGDYKIDGDTITFSGKGIGVDAGTIGSDGSITLKVSAEGFEDAELVFKK